MQKIRAILIISAVVCLVFEAQAVAEPGSRATYRLRARPLGSRGGVEISGDGYGSAIAPVPGRPDEYYLLSDRGPNVDGPQPNSKVFAIPDYQPAIARYKLRGRDAELAARIPLSDSDGAPLSGLVPLREAGSTGETAYDSDGHVLAPRGSGVDPEGLVALADGTFWISEEYAPSLMHVSANGRLLERVTPFGANSLGHRLPAELARRIPNRGIESLAVTPDGGTLVALMQSALANDIEASDAKTTAALRLVTFRIATGETHVYIYLLDDPASFGTMTSDIAAISAASFAVIEEDVLFLGTNSKRKSIYEISLDDATDVAAESNDLATGRLYGGATIERATKSMPTAAADAALRGLGIRPVRKKLVLDLNAFLGTSDPKRPVFAHDKIEGIAVIDGGRRLVLSNDCDFGIAATSPPSIALHQKTVPSTGARDVGEILVVTLPKRLSP